MRHIFGFLLLLLGVGGECRIALAQSPGTFVATGGMTAPRSGHTATLLANGKVLIAGGEAGSTQLSTAELYDPVSGTFTPTGDMRAPRSLHSATLLPDGRVLIAGGTDASLADIPTNGAEIYDPSTGTFAATGNMISGHVCQQATLLGNGKVLIAGGSRLGDYSAGNPELYDSATGTFAVTGAYASDTSGFNTCQGAVSTLLPDGRVSIVWETAVAEIYDPDSGSFTPTRKPIAVSYSDGLPTATLLLNGKLLVAGGADDSGIHTSAELYDFSIGSFTATGNMTTGRTLHTATLLPDGTVLIAGSSLFGGGALASAELYDPVTGGFSVTGTMITAHQGEGHTATLLNSGRVLIAGANADPLSPTAELYTPRVLVSAPVLFSLSGDGRGQGAIWHASTGHVASGDNPAIAGEALSMYTANLGSGGVIPPQVSVGGQLANVLYFGGAPGYPGYNQVNFALPNDVTPGAEIAVRLTYLDRPSNAVTIGVQ